MHEVSIIGEQVAGEAEKLRRELEGTISHWNKSTFDIAEILHKIKKNGFYKSYGFNTFIEFISELNIKKRKAEYITRIVEVMEDVNIPRDEFEPVGTAKLREITSLKLYDDNGDPSVYNTPEGETLFIKDIITGLVAKAPAMELKEIQNYIRIIKGFVGDNDVVWVNFCINKSALIETVEPAINLALANLGNAGKDEEGVAKDYSKGKALEVISAEYLNDPANSYLGGKYVFDQTEKGNLGKDTTDTQGD